MDIGNCVIQEKGNSIIIETLRDIALKAIRIIQDLKYSFDMDEEAEAVEEAVSRVLDQGLRTGDMMAEGCTLVSCSEMGDAILKAL